MRRVRGTDDGFSLVELLVVIGILGILTSIALPSVASQKSKARRAAMRMSLRDAAHTQETLAAGGLPYAPAGPGGLAALRANGFNETEGVTVEVLSATTSGYCLRAQAVGLADLYLSSTGPHAGVLTPAACS